MFHEMMKIKAVNMKMVRTLPYKMQIAQLLNTTGSREITLFMNSQMDGCLVRKFRHDFEMTWNHKFTLVF